MTALALLPLHMGSLHSYEKVLTLLIAFGPFVVLGFVVHRTRKHDLAQEAAQEAAEVQGPTEETT